jgi:hypothetical protein
MDLATLTNAPREVTLAGKVYKVSALTLAEWGELQAWLKDNVPDPVERALAQLAKAKAAGVDVQPEDRLALLKEARIEAKAWPPRVATTAWIEAIESVGNGVAMYVFVVLRKHQPGITLEAAKAIANDPDLTVPEMTTFARRALGFDDPKKATGADGGTATTPPPNSTSGATCSTHSVATASADSAA